MLGRSKKQDISELHLIHVTFSSSLSVLRSTLFLANFRKNVFLDNIFFSNDFLKKPCQTNRDLPLY